MLVTEINDLIYFTIYKMQNKHGKKIKLEGLAPRKISETARRSSSQESGTSKSALLNRPSCAFD